MPRVIQIGYTGWLLKWTYRPIRFQECCNLFATSGGNPKAWQKMSIHFKLCTALVQDNNNNNNNNVNLYSAVPIYSTAHILRAPAWSCKYFTFKTNLTKLIRKCLCIRKCPRYKTCVSRSLHHLLLCSWKPSWYGWRCGTIFFKLDQSIDLMHWRHVSITTTPCWGSRLVVLRARVVLAERVGALIPSDQSVRGPGPGQPGGMACRGWTAGCMLGDSACGSASFDPQHAGGPFCDVICIWSVCTLEPWTGS